MAIKGCSRQMIVLNGTGSSIFEAAYFIVRADGRRQRSQGDMLREANRIVEESCFEGGQAGGERGGRAMFGAGRRGRTASVLLFAAGVLCGGGVTGLVWLLTRVFGG